MHGVSQSGGLTLTLDGRTMADMIADGPEDDRHLRTIAAHTSAYITHVRRQLKHTLPKAIVHCLVRPALDAYGLASVYCGLGHLRTVLTTLSQRFLPTEPALEQGDHSLQLCDTRLDMDVIDSSCNGLPNEWYWLSSR